MLIERVLVLLRNILHVPTTDVDKIVSFSVLYSFLLNVH